MIKILVISDTHGDISLMQNIALSHPNFDYYLHLGDSEISDFYMGFFVSVKGNCDYGYDFPINRRIKTKYGDIYMEHGNTYYFKDEEYVLNKNARIFLHGHTHIHYLKEIKNGSYIACPGSLTRPRDNTNGTYLEIYLDENKIDFVFKEID